MAQAFAARGGPRRLGRFTITRKFVGLSVILLATMLAAAIYAFFQAASIDREAKVLVEALEPLKQEIASIVQATAEEELASERALRYGGPQVRDTARHGEQLARFETYNREIDARLAALTRHIRAYEDAEISTEAAVALGRLQLESETVRREHATYRAAVRAFLAPGPVAIDGTSLRESEAIDSEKRVLSALERMSGEAAALAKKDEARLAGLERRSFIVSVENLGLAIFGFVAGSVISLLLTRRMLTPVRSLIAGAEEVGRGNLDVTLPTTQTDEIGQLSHAFLDMVEELRTKAAMRTTFSSYMDPRVVDRLLGAGRAELEAGEKREMTVYFSDLQNFSTIAETLTPTALVRLINRYLAYAGEPIARYQGVIDKYIGDAVMAYWGAPFSSDEPALSACRAALGQRQQLAMLQKELPELLGLRRGAPKIAARIGLATGDVVLGSIGSLTSKNFTIMGDTVNIASRLEGANKAYGTLILADEATVIQVRNRIEVREIDLLAPAGKTEAMRVFELIGEIGAVPPEQIELRDAFEAGLAAYRAGDWDGAEARFGECLRIVPDDGPATTFLGRVASFRSAAPADGWGGVWQSVTK
ncbi:adenylate/guanylate cyclase domain-containing protein [Sphingomonas sp. BIUV-7]|uniref:Adenylate/guanylate cyclase domain-containing protein n=1 Tax=Sphingomonas natans TaxID=3063330 RepID=A0ABT8Y4G6_9SPHN|nr:adenylate/guanylate cyclase domain-containing protein [Sphingomonas sp. BIUV-7]MDO6413213.1 adenylate/guanylate cyclase domain-containing protein [Sphingomonas sp. BIUV-7]